ncbi:hypothetical protein D623_10020474 [Myotis brandtii]|uniref:Uncharacterized protein n=1 Tax=Myotis brandtii TaxID=109478 RepID=S7PWV0_MYOBR|nr:hypothetical protein D623_10020474 [Myotis brandtii]
MAQSQHWGLGWWAQLQSWVIGEIVRGAEGEESVGKTPRFPRPRERKHFLSKSQVRPKEVTVPAGPPRTLHVLSKSQARPKVTVPAGPPRTLH